MGYREHTAEFMKAVRGGRGELDAWLECNNEAECRAAILGALQEAAEAEREACAKLVEAGKTIRTEHEGTVVVDWDCSEEAAEAIRARSNDQHNRPASAGPG